jgi:predicted pyridoxine 5'-phosphate oxidase superfamily flavin-nucleotide-binding protein
MVALPEKVIENIHTLKGQARAVLATVSDAGVPNVVPVGAVIVKDPETILIGDNFFKKTAENMRRPNCNVAVTSWIGVKGYQVKGTGNYVTDGPDYETMKQAIKAFNPNLPVKGCLVMKVTEVFDVAPGPSAGEKIA